jgi:hypothetical protein
VFDVGSVKCRACLECWTNFKLFYSYLKKLAYPLELEDNLVQTVLFPVVKVELLALLGRLVADLGRHGRPVPPLRPELRLYGLDFLFAPGCRSLARLASVSVCRTAVAAGTALGAVVGAAAGGRVCAAAHLPNLSRDSLETGRATFLCPGWYFCNGRVRKVRNRRRDESAETSFSVLERRKLVSQEVSRGTRTTSVPLPNCDRLTISPCSMTRLSQRRLTGLKSGIGRTKNVQIGGIHSHAARSF